MVRFPRGRLRILWDGLPFVCMLDARKVGINTSNDLESGQVRLLAGESERVLTRIFVEGKM
jgi:hypothetical protein